MQGSLILLLASDCMPGFYLGWWLALCMCVCVFVWAEPRPRSKTAKSRGEDREANATIDDNKTREISQHVFFCSFGFGAVNKRLGATPKASFICPSGHVHRQLRTPRTSGCSVYTTLLGPLGGRVPHVCSRSPSTGTQRFDPQFVVSRRPSRTRKIKFQLKCYKSREKPCMPSPLEKWTLHLEQMCAPKVKNESPQSDNLNLVNNGKRWSCSLFAEVWCHRIKDSEGKPCPCYG